MRTIITYTLCLGTCGTYHNRQPFLNLFSTCSGPSLISVTLLVPPPCHVTAVADCVTRLVTIEAGQLARWPVVRLWATVVSLVFLAASVAVVPT